MKMLLYPAKTADDPPNNKLSISCAGFEKGFPLIVLIRISTLYDPRKSPRDTVVLEVFLLAGRGSPSCLQIPGIKRGKSGARPVVSNLAELFKMRERVALFPGILKRRRLFPSSFFIFPRFK